MATH